MKTEKESTHSGEAGLLCAAPKRHTVRVFLVSYLPHALKDERVNIAVAMIAMVSPKCGLRATGNEC
jgi:hypothetical protein